MKILMIGLGSIGQRHLRNILTLLGEEAEISAYRVRRQQAVITENLTVEKRAELDKKYKYVLHDSLDAALAASPEAVFICNPTSMHLPAALEAARNGYHLFIEKPLSHNLDGIEELQSIVEKKNLVAFVGFQLRFHPCYLQLKILIEKQKVGLLLSVQIEVGDYLPGWHRWENYQRMYTSRRELGGGVVLTQIHEIDYAMDLFGLPKSVYALGGHFSSLEMDVEDVSNMLMEFPYRNRILPVFIHMDYSQRPPSRKCKVIGEKGTITMDFVSRSIVVVDNNGKEERFIYKDFQRNQPYLDELKHFFACIRGEEKPLVDIETAFKGMKIAIAVKESMEKGEKAIIF